MLSGIKNGAKNLGHKTFSSSIKLKALNMEHNRDKLKELANDAMIAYRNRIERKYSYVWVLNDKCSFTPFKDGVKVQVINPLDYNECHGINIYLVNGSQRAIFENSGSIEFF
jgi:hypothetical protein